MGSDTSKPEPNNQLHLRLDRQPKWSNNDVQMPTIRLLHQTHQGYVWPQRGVHLPCRPWHDDREQYLTRLITSMVCWYMKTILTNPLIVLGDFNIANFNILRDSTLLGTAVNIDQLTSFSQDTSVYTCCLLAPRRDSTPKLISTLRDFWASPTLTRRPIPGDGQTPLGGRDKQNGRYPVITIMIQILNKD